MPPRSTRGRRRVDVGFSVSGSFAIIVIGTFIAFGMFYGSAANAVEQVTDAQQAAHHDRLEQYNTDINVTRADWQTGGDCGLGNTCLILDVQNDGTTTLSTDATDVFVDGYFVPDGDYSQEDVDGDATTSLWLPGEEYHIEIERTIIEDFLEPSNLPPERVQVVTERGVADARGVA